MSKLDEVIKAIGLAKTLIDGGVALSDVAARRRDEERKRADEEKDKKIAALEAENARLKAIQPPPQPPAPTKVPGQGMA